MNIFPNKINLLYVACCMILNTAIALPLQAKDIQSKPVGSWVSLSGQVWSHTPKSFTLDYGEGTILVETDDWDKLGDGWALNEGDHVTVYGRIDDGFYQTRRIEAGSIYIKDINTMVTAPSAADEEIMPNSYTYFSVPAEYGLQVAGTVTSVSGRSFTIDTGSRKVTVDTMALGYNPLDEVGIQRIEKGDFVTVSGDLDIGMFDKSEIEARTIISYN
ncbi:DUF5666 domain-containing protein [Rheinheimera aquimaris]|uniref:DUF5666 domain-containing protein n=1 Tax=Rheinheimera aquimaris TaxID=412437 RepID=UPI003A983E48